VNDFLAFGRQSPPQIAPCDLKATVELAVSVVGKQAKAQDISIVSGLPVDLPSLQADAAQLKTCFLNILTNSVQAMPHGGSIHIEAKTMQDGHSEARLQLRFLDTGPGIPEQDQEKIFAPYFSTKATGFGLGLAITRKIVEDHGGQVYVSRQNGTGAEMVLELPLSGPRGARAAELAGSTVA
jgi:signal transduction histidine kinase